MFSLSLSIGVYILIVAGAVMMVVGFLGCCGAIRESACMLGLVSPPIFFYSTKHLYYWCSYTVKNKGFSYCWCPCSLHLWLVLALSSSLCSCSSFLLQRWPLVSGDCPMRKRWVTFILLSQVTFIYIVQIVSKQLHRNKKEDGSIVKFQQY